MASNKAGLIGCEESQTVALAFRSKGLDFYSNDLIDCSGGHPQYHLKMDVIEAIKSQPRWAFIGLHPVCTKMTLSGNKHYAPGKPKHHERIAAVDFTLKLCEIAKEHADRVYLENPMGALNGDPRLPKPQIIQPYYFGDEAEKTTCLWLHNLPMLYHNDKPNLFDPVVTHVSKGEFHTTKGGKKMPKWYNLPPSEDRQKIRSKTFPGIANAMADQWGKLLQ